MVNGGWMPTAVFSPESGITREKLQVLFKEANVDARVFFWPLSSLSMFDDKPTNKLAWDIPTRAINLPSYHDLSGKDIKQVIDSMTDNLYPKNANRSKK